MTADTREDGPEPFADRSLTSVVGGPTGPTLSVPPDVQAAIDRALRVPLDDVVRALEQVIRDAAPYAYKNGPSLQYPEDEGD